MELKKRPCPVCSSTDDSNVIAESNYNTSNLNPYSFASRKIPELMHFRLVLCPGCDLLYATPSPVSDSLESAYREAAYDSKEESMFAARVYFKYLSRFLNTLPNLIGALDIGAGDGAFLKMLLDAGFRDLTGVEPSRAPIMAAKPEVRDFIRQGVFSEMRLQEGAFSLITCFQTLEHLDNPLDVCSASYRLLKSGGAIFIVSHNYRSLSAKILGMKSPIYDIEHLQLFSPSSIERLLLQTGFRDIRVFPIVNRYPLHYWLKILPIGITFRKKIISFAKSISLGYLALPLWAGNMAAIGYKKE